MSGLTMIPAEFSWWTAFATLIPVIGTLLGLTRAVQSGLRRRASKKWDQSYTDIQSIYQTIQQLLADTPASRVLVIKSENGGGIPTPDGAVTNTVIHEVCDSAVDPVQKLWSNIPLDRSYSRVITEVSTQGVTDVGLKDLPKDPAGNPAGELADLFELCGCDHVRLLRICATGSALLYICVCLSEAATLKPADRLKIRAAARVLCGIFANHHQLIKREARE